jgi:hypothetical protein
MENNNIDINTNNSSANTNTMTSTEHTMSKDATIELEHRIDERATAANSKSYSSKYIRLKDGQSFKTIFTGNADEQMVDFT